MASRYYQKDGSILQEINTGKCLETHIHLKVAGSEPAPSKNRVCLGLSNYFPYASA